MRAAVRSVCVRIPACERLRVSSHVGTNPVDASVVLVPCVLHPFSQEDKKVKDRIDSRNGLEGYCYNLKNMLEDDEKGLADKLR